MKEFILLFRTSNTNDPSKLSPKEMEAMLKKWHDWMDQIASQGKLSSSGNRLTPEGKVLKPGGVITDGPFVEIKERLGGFIAIKAESFDEAVTLAHGCPVLEVGGNVEIREILM